MIKHLTKFNIDKLPLKTYRYSVWDTETTGFGMRVSPTGNKTYIMKYMSPLSNTQENYTIGRHGNLTPKTARTEAIRLRGLIASGKDPQASKLENRAAMTVLELCDLYLKKGCFHKKESTIKTDIGRIERHIKPLIGNKTVKNLTKVDIINMYNDIKAGKTALTIRTKKHGLARVTGGEGTALKSRKLLSAILNFAVDEQVIEKNPAQRIKLGKDKRNQRYLNEIEIKKLTETLENAIENDENIYPALVIKILLLTGCRKGEILNLLWEELNIVESRLELSDSKTGAKSVYISAEVLELFKTVPRIKGCKHIFPGRTLSKPYQGLQKYWSKIRVVAGIEDVRLHDLRHTYASLAASNGQSLLVIGKLLGHKDSRTTQRYAHINENTEKQAIEKVSQLYSKIHNDEDI